MESFRSQTIDPTVIPARLKIDHRENFRNHRIGSFNCFPIHVDKVKCSVGRIDEIGRAKPIVGGAKKFGFLFITTGADPRFFSSYSSEFKIQDAEDEE